MDWNRYPKRSTGLDLTEAIDGFVVSSANSDEIHFLNPVATFILESCDGQRRAADLPELVALAFDLDAVPNADVEACLDALYSKGLIMDEGPSIEASPEQRLGVA